MSALRRGSLCVISLMLALQVIGVAQAADKNKIVRITNQ